MTDKRFGAKASERAAWSGVDAVDGSSTGIAMYQHCGGYSGTENDR